MKNAPCRRVVALLAGSAVLLLSAACSIGGSDETPTATTAAVAASPTAGQTAVQTTGSPTAAASPTRSASPTAASPTTGSPTSGSPTAETQPTRAASPTGAVATATTAAAATATATSAPETAVGEIVPLDPEAVPNYTLTIKLAATGLGGPGDSTFDYDIQQSATDRYHLKADSSGTALEIWKIGDQAFIAQAGGEPAPLPEGSDTALFSPVTFLQVIPPIDAATNGQDLGTETIDGRSVRHFRLSADEYLNGVPFLGQQEFSNAEGELDIWVDEELKTPLRQQGEVTWTNADDSEGRFTIDYQLTAIGSTPDVQAPATP